MDQEDPVLRFARAIEDLENNNDPNNNQEISPEMNGPEMNGPEMIGPEMIGPEVSDFQLFKLWVISTLQTILLYRFPVWTLQLILQKR